MLELREPVEALSHAQVRTAISKATADLTAARGQYERVRLEAVTAYARGTLLPATFDELAWNVSRLEDILVGLGKLALLAEYAELLARCDAFPDRIATASAAIGVADKAHRELSNEGFWDNADFLVKEKRLQGLLGDLRRADDAQAKILAERETVWKRIAQLKHEHGALLAMDGS